VEKGDRGASGHSLRASRLRKMASARQRLRRGRCDARAMIQGSRQTTIHACPDSPPSFFALRGHALWLLVISIHAKSCETVLESG